MFDLYLVIGLKIDPSIARVGDHRDHRVGQGQGQTTGYGHSTNSGPHESNVMNKADPRFDSDRDHRAAGTTGYGTSQTGGAPGLTGTGTGTGGYGTSHTAGSTNYGAHDSNLANKLDPNVGSGLDHRGTHGTTTHGTHTGAHTGTGAYGSGTTGSTNYGAHDSNLDHRGTLGTGTTTHGTHGTQGTTSAGYSSGTHDAPVLNKLDPRFDSDRDHRAAGTGGYGTSHTAGSTGAYGGDAGYGSHASAPYGSTTGTTAHGTHGTHGTQTGTGTTGLPGHGTHGAHGAQTAGTGPAPHTAGPHKSDMLNKLDPRVDSNLDGSQTMGGDKTFSSGPLA